jgi:hypothetical protein
MASTQRRRGINVVIYPEKTVTNRRGEKVIVPDGGTPIPTRAAIVPQRSARAELPGQQQVNVTRIIVSADLPNVDLWASVEIDGHMWDVAAPPAYHHGTRQTRHISIDLRKRPNDAPPEAVA